MCPSYTRCLSHQTVPILQCDEFPEIAGTGTPTLQRSKNYTFGEYCFAN
nr:MAG TPA: hypothetical protein [Caudoviricetes sp.]